MVAMSPWPSMPKPVTGLPVLAMPSTTRLVQPSSMPMTTTAATFGLAPVPIRVRKMQVEVLAELQPAIGVRQRHRALDVVGDRLAGGVRQIVERQDDDVVAHADAAVLAPPAHERQVDVPFFFATALPFFLSSFAMSLTTASF